MDNAGLKKILSEDIELQKDLFIRGFLITDGAIKEMDHFPFYGNWKTEKHAKYYFMAHELTGMHVWEDEKSNIFFIMGHAYNPFTMQYQEQDILKDLAAAYKKGGGYIS